MAQRCNCVIDYARKLIMCLGVPKHIINFLDNDQIEYAILVP